MKKKILLLIAIASVLACLFAISISAATTETIDGVTYYLNNGTASVTNANQKCALETVIIPEVVIGADGKEYTVKTINQQAFKDNKTIKYVSLPATMTKLDAAAFYGCSNLVFVDFNDNQNTITSSSYGIFRNCSSLKAICLPDGMTNIPDQAFTNGTSLTAVYLPARVEYIKGNKTANDGPAFGNSPEMYLVNEKFEVRDENGNFYTAETFVLPEKPEVYYFPSTLKTITGSHNINGSFTMDEYGMVANNGLEDCAFYNLPNINSVLVLPEGYQGYDDRVIASNNAQLTDHRGDTIQNGLFQKCGTKENPLTVVFLGKIDRVSMGRKGEYQYTTYVFANEANTGFENTKIGTWYNTSDTGYSNQNEIYVVFCHANNGEGAKYKIGFTGSNDNKTYPVLTSELQEDAVIHTVSPNANTVVSEPTCVLGTVVNTFCFCGKAIDTNKEILGSALGHEYSLDKGATKHSIVYANYLADGVLNTKCARCDECDGSKVNPIISSFKGFSVKENGSGLTIGYTVDYDALDNYAKINGKNVELGFVFAIQSKVTDNKLLDTDGTKINDSVVKASFVTYAYEGSENVRKHTGAELRISGNFENIKDVAICIAGYIYDGNVVYLNSNSSSDSADFITYGQLINA